MKKHIFLLVLPIFLFANCTENTEGFIKKLTDDIKTHKSLHYKITEKLYYSDIPDTTITPFEVWLVRDDIDSIRNGYAWVDNNYRPYNMIYDRGDFYLSIPPKNTTILYSNFSESLISEVDWMDVFFKPETLLTLSADSTINTIISDTLYNGIKCTQVSFEFQDKKNGAEITHTYITDKTKLVPIWAKFTSKTKDRISTSELFFTDFEFDNTEIEKLKEKHKKVLSENPLEPKDANSQVSRLERMIHIGDKAPLFAGKFYNSSNEFKLDSFIGKNIIIVDFWYTHCPPCVQAMPYLSELYTEYKDRGLKLFGLNSVDNQAHSLDNLSKFLGKRQVSYDIILTEPAVDMMYKINGYPSMYIIDKNGKIAFVEIGFNEEKFSKLKEKIEEMLE